VTFEKKHFEVVADLKAVGDGSTGEFEGYGSVFGNIDAYDDIVAKGAFVESLKQKMPVLLWQHDPSKPIGIYTEAREDERGLYLKGKLATGVQQAREAQELLKMNALKGMSIGFRTLEDEVDRKTGIRTLKKIDLMEVSLVTFPANDKANVTGVKSAPGTIREFEKFLREAGGYSSEDAKLVASKGFNALTTHREGGELALAGEALEGALAAIKKITKVST
jgi:HK97 family phage prohead protease